MKKFFLVSCLGCGGLLLIAVVSVALLGWVGSKRAEFTDASASYEPLTEAEVADSVDLSSELPEGEIAPPGAGANRVTIKVTGVDDVQLRPCDPGEGPKVDATYDMRRVWFSETMTRRDDGGWDFEVEMKGTGSQLTRLAQRVFGGRGSTLEMCLPLGSPIELTVAAARGGLEAELGGLLLTDVDLSFEAGGGFVGFSEPLAQPADHVSIRASMGGGFISGLGNASPATLAIDNSFGGFTVDMSGEWKNDSFVTMKSRASGATLLVPRSVRVAGVPESVSDTVDLSESVPLLTFAPGTNFDEVTISRN